MQNFNDKTAWQEFKQLIQEKGSALLKWFLPKKNQLWYVSIIMFILKLPLLIIFIALSPVMLLILIFTFVVVL